jgi:hypothetical protein
MNKRMARWEARFDSRSADGHGYVSPRRFRAGGPNGSGMSKIIALVIIGMMAIQIIKPIGLPGLRQRRDFWKLAVFAFGAFALDVFLTHLA